MEKKLKILLIYPKFSSFVRRDYEMLSAFYEVDKYEIILPKSLVPFLWKLIKQFFFLLFKAHKYDTFFIWFVDYHAFLPALFAKLFSKKSIAIVGGFDTASVPELKYGLFYKNNLRARLAKLTYRLLGFILPVDQSLIDGTNSYISPVSRPTGIRNFVSGVKAVMEAVPTGYDSIRWKRLDVPKYGDVITVGASTNMTPFYGKGHDLFIATAVQLPELTFTLVGVSKAVIDSLENPLPKNVVCHQFLPQDELIKLFSGHTIFTQFSLSEGLPNTLCEAMLCGCIPIGSSVNGIPYAIGETGYILESPDPIQASELILKALEPNNGLKDPRERIKTHFSKERRVAALRRVIEL